MKSVLPVVVCAALFAGSVWCQQTRSPRKTKELEQELSLDPDPRKLKKDARPQVLELLKDPPQAVVVDTQRMVHFVSPLSAKGLLSQQVRDGLRALMSSARGANIVKIRAFVAGTGDMRRVQTIVSETFTERRQPLPALSVAQVGALPLEGAQVVMEAIALEKSKLTAPHGIALIAAQPATASDAVGPLKSVLATTSVEPAGVRRVTCFLNALENVETVRKQVTESFPEAASNYVQLRRDSMGDFVACEAVAATVSASAKSVDLIGSPAQVVRLGPGRIVLSGTQMAFGQEDGDLRLAFGRLDKALETSGTDMKKVVFARVYSLTSAAAQKLLQLRAEYFDQAAQPATTSLMFEGLPALDASIGLDVVALAK
jgi:enamine deaminase RidA (YjgF/YER057c/UK114 family)